MEKKTGNIPSLGEAATLYLGKLSTKDRDTNQPEVYKFARWYGWESSFDKLAGPAVAGYAEQLSTSDTDYENKFTILRAFFAYGKKAGWSPTNLGIHLKAKKGKAATTTGGRRQVTQEAISLTQQSHDDFTKELKDLKKRSQELMAEIQRAAADKDFRENAPLHAAREERGHVEGRIKELERTLKSATIMQEKKEVSRKSSIGDSIVVCELATGEECKYMIVDPREVNAAKGKISFSSPLGKALLGHCDGETVDIHAPAGRLQYKIIRIER